MKNKVFEKLKIIDFYKKGNQVKFYLGDVNDNEYWGDDWNDAPYEHNAGTVYSEYVVATIVKTFDFEDIVVETCDGEYNSGFAKEDMKKRVVPCICVLDKKYIPEDTWNIDTFASVVGNKNSTKFYFGDIIDVEEEKENITFVDNSKDTYVKITYNEKEVDSDILKIAVDTFAAMLDSMKFTYNKNVKKAMETYSKKTNKEYADLITTLYNEIDTRFCGGNGEVKKLPLKFQIVDDINFAGKKPTDSFFFIVIQSTNCKKVGKIYKF